MPSDLPPLDWLSLWYAQQCNEDWEHSYGIKIDTLDNPGWTLTIDLTETSLSRRPFDRQSVNPGSEDGTPNTRWHTCWVDDDQFQAACGVYDLSTVVNIFRRFAES